MSKENQDFLEILNKYNVDITPDLMNGELSEVLIKRSGLRALVTLRFPEILCLESFHKVFDAVDKCFTEIGFKEVLVSIEYDTDKVDDDLLEQYYNAAVSELESKYKRYSVLREINKEISNNKIIFFVADESEAKVLESMVYELYTRIKEYGINVLVCSQISTFETPIAKIIEENNRLANSEFIKQETLLSNDTSAKVEDDYNTTNGAKKKWLKPPKAKSLISQIPTPLKDLPATEADLIEYNQQYGTPKIVVTGTVIKCDIIDRVSYKSGEAKKFSIYKATIFDGEDAVVLKTFINLQIDGQHEFFKEQVKEGKVIRACGQLSYDPYEKDIVFNSSELMVEGNANKTVKTDYAPVKRVELHAHSKMSVQDSVLEVKDYVGRASEYKHRALAITDMHNIQAWPDFYDECKKNNILPILGLEGELVDEDKYKIALVENEETDNIDLQEATYVVYDLETTGFSSNYNEIIEIAAAKVVNGDVVDTFSTFVHPRRSIPEQITELTSISNDDVRDAPFIEDILPKFYEFFKGCVLVAHNATFDNSHLMQGLMRLGIDATKTPTIDTLELAKARYGHGTKLKKFNLKALCNFFDVDLLQHHRAIDDATATAYVFIKMLNDLIEAGVVKYKDINKSIDMKSAHELAYPTHFTLLSMNEVGKKNMYELISDSHTVHYYKKPLILKSFLDKHREGLLVGSGCMNGDVFIKAYEKSYDELLEAMKYYDYIELQTPSAYSVLTMRFQDKNVTDFIKSTIKTIIKAANELGKIVVATGNCHHLEKEDLLLRKIYIDAPQIGGGIHPLKEIPNIPSTHYMNTEEMLKEFEFLGKDLAYEIVVTNTNKIADMIESYLLFPEKLFTPKDDMLASEGIPSFREGVEQMTFANARKIYGENLPKFIEDRINKELGVILGRDYASIYYISHLLVKYSTDAGYVVGSRGSVGSSLVATFMNITEVNPLPPHYSCPHCHFFAMRYSDEEKKIYVRTPEEIGFDKDLQLAYSGYDLPEAVCPICGEKLNRNGLDIPFETFLGNKTDAKVPDIDLNFSSEFQSQAHEFCRTMFGAEHAFRAGTIQGVADKTAYGYVMNYFERHNEKIRPARINMLVEKVAGVKRSTGQHPGGIVVLPKEIEYTDIIPIQYPADDVDAAWRTTHYDYHKFEHNLLKLDILGHDDPTMIKYLMGFVHKYPDEFDFDRVDGIPIIDKNVFKLFNSLESLNIKSEDFVGETLGTTGLPEFGTPLSKDLLKEAKPTTYADLLKISGLSHGTNVWNGNALEFLHGRMEGYPMVPFKDLIGCRDDIMVYLISKGLPSGDAFKIMEKVRKGKGVSLDFEKEMIAYGVAPWYIASCKLIAYMFPKAHAAAYVIMALRIGWFKIYKPLYYYSGFFSKRAKGYDIEAMAGGTSAIKKRLVELNNKVKNKTASNKESEIQNTLLLALEASLRGIKFKQVDIKLSDACDFIIDKEENALIIPFVAIDSLGESMALSIIEARNERMFTSKKDVMKRTKVNNSRFEDLERLGAFGDLLDDDVDSKLGLF